MTITASAAHAATKVSEEDHDIIINKIRGRRLRHLVNADDMDHADRFAGIQSMSYVYEEEEEEDGTAFL